MQAFELWPPPLDRFSRVSVGFGLEKLLMPLELREGLGKLSPLGHPFKRQREPVLLKDLP